MKEEEQEQRKEEHEGEEKREEERDEKRVGNSRRMNKYEEGRQIRRELEREVRG